MILRMHAARRCLQVVLPPGIPEAAGLNFAKQHLEWARKQLQKRQLFETRLVIGSEILLRGVRVTIEPSPEGIRIDKEVTMVRPGSDLERWVVTCLYRLALREIPARVIQLAKQHAVPVRRIAIKNQRRRWGSFSAKGTISLNWRVIQMPPLVQDYLILHELMHYRQMNHSDLFWAEIQTCCPGYEVAEKWIKDHGAELMALGCGQAVATIGFSGVRPGFPAPSHAGDACCIPPG